MNAIDGLESPDLFDLIVTELSQEFPELSRSDIAALVEQRRQKIARPASGGALFLEVQKLLQLQHDQLVAR